MKFNLDGVNAYVIRAHSGGYVINDCHGFYMDPEQMIEVSKGLLACAVQHYEDIKAYNVRHAVEFEKQIKEAYNLPKKEKDKAYIYMFECGGKYKIGLSRDVERRIKELDYRPFNINLIAKSGLLSDPYKIERELHEKYDKYRLTGEWFTFSEKQVNEIISYLNEVK